MKLEQGELPHMKYEMLFSPLRAGRIELKNRIAMSPMGVNLAGTNGEANPEIIRYYEERAKGGAGLIITEITRIDEQTGIGIPGQLSATSIRHVRGLQRLADTIHRYGTKIFVQLHHPGKEASSLFLNGVQQVSASALPSIKGEMARALSTEEVEDLVKKFVRGAVYAQMAGLDGVEIHAAHSYLVNQFLSPKYNHRSDKYGGSFENRLRFLLEILAGIRFTCPSLLISVRISADEFLPDGNHLAEGIEIAKAIENAGADLINVSNGTHESGITIMEPYTYPQGWKKHLAKAVREAVRIPVIAVNTVKEPAFAEQLLEEGVCDVVSLGRCMLADPDWVAKARSGMEDRIRSCIGCMQCFSELGKAHHIACALNPRLGRELEYPEIVRDCCGKTAVVVGGGPAGMEAARVLALRGFATHLFEKCPQLGGALNLANKAPHKEILDGFVSAMRVQMKDAGVEVHLNTEATPDLIREYRPDAVFLACGARPIIPDLPGAELAFTYEQILSGEKETGGKVLVVGGGLTGLETAEYLGCRGKDVSVIEMTETVGAGVYASVLLALMQSLQKNHVSVMKKHRLLRIEKAQAVIMDPEGKEVSYPCDTVVLALGLRPDRSKLDEFRSAFPEAVVIGDAVAGRRIMEATKEGFGCAYSFRPLS